MGCLVGGTEFEMDNVQIQEETSRRGSASSNTPQFDRSSSKQGSHGSLTGVWG